MSTKWVTDSDTANFSKKEHVSGAVRERGSGKSGERERSVEREAAERERSGERVSQK